MSGHGFMSWVGLLTWMMVWGGVLGNLVVVSESKTGIVSSPEGFHAGFTPGVAGRINRLVVNLDLWFDDARFWPNVRLDHGELVVSSGGFDGGEKMVRELVIPEKAMKRAVVTFGGSSNITFEGLSFLIERSSKELDQGLVGLWNVDGNDAQVLYDKCTFAVDQRAFDILNNTQGLIWDEAQGLVGSVSHGPFTYQNSVFKLQKSWVEAPREVIRVKDPKDVSWLKEIQRPGASRLEVHLTTDISVDLCMLANASNGKLSGPIPVKRPVVIQAHNHILQFSPEVVQHGFLKIDQYPLMLKRAVLDFQDVDTRTIRTLNGCHIWGCSLAFSAFPTESQGLACTLSMKNSTVITPGGIHDKPESSPISFPTVVSSGFCLLNVKFSTDNSLSHSVPSFPCKNSDAYAIAGVNSSDPNRALGSIEITVIALLVAGIIAVAICLIVAFGLSANKWSLSNQFMQKFVKKAPTSSSSDGLPDSIVVSPDPEMGIYAPRIDMDFKLMTDKAPMWIFEEIFNQSNYQRDHSFVLGEQIAAGGFGVVYKGTWKGIPVAIKTVVFQDKGHKELQQNKERARAIVEAAISSSVAHPNIVQTYAFSFKRVSKRSTADEDSEKQLNVKTPHAGSAKKINRPRRLTNWKLYMVQELCNAGSLNAALYKRAFMDATNSPSLLYILQLALETGRGMLHLHRHNIIHGDLTTRNILLQKEEIVKGGVQITAKIADFGLSQKMEKSQNHVANHWAGTPFYMAPEVVQNGHLSKPADVFSFGIVLWEMYHSMECFQEQEDTSLDSSEGFGYHPLFPKFPVSCPMPLVMLCVSCLSPDPEDRPDFPLICKALSALLAKVKKGDYSSPSSIQASNKETSAAIGKIESGQMVNIVASLLAIDSQRSVQSRSMDVAQQSTAVSLHQMPFYWPNEHTHSQSQSLTGDYHSVPSGNQDAQGGAQKFEVQVFSYDESEAKNANPSIKFAADDDRELQEGSSRVPEEDLSMDGLEDGLQPWSFDADDIDDAEKGLASPSGQRSEFTGKHGVGITIGQKITPAGHRGISMSTRDQVWEMDNGVLAGMGNAPFSLSGDQSALSLKGGLPTLKEEFGDEGRDDNTYTPMDHSECIPDSTEDIFLTL